MQPDPLAGQQVVVDRLGEQGVPERVAVAAHREQHVALDGGAQGGVEGADLSVQDPLEQQVGDPPAGDRGGPDHQACVVLELVEPHQQQVGEGLGQRTWTLGGGLHELLGEERVALGPLDDAAHRALGERLGVQRLDQGPDVVVAEAGQVDAGDAGQPGPLGGCVAQRMAAVQVVAAVGRDHGHRGVEAPENRKLSSSRVERSAQWTSSISSSSGAARPSSSSAACADAKRSGRSRWPLSSAGSGCSGMTRRAGISRAMAGPASTSERATVGESAASRPKASLNGR